MENKQWKWQFTTSPDGTHHNALVDEDVEVVLYERPHGMNGCTKEHAQLIATAPEMEEMLSLTIRTVYDCFRHFTMSSRCQETLEALIDEEIKPLLAKVKGGK